MLDAREIIMKPKLVTKEFQTVSQVKGPLIFVERVAGAAFGEMVEIIDPAGEARLGQV